MKTYLLLLMWVPVVVEKYLRFDSFRAGMLRQPLPGGLVNFLTWFLPVAELAVVLLLLVHRWRILGYILSTGLLVLFTGYVGLAVLGAWGELPCTCGSVISRLTWKQHFFFNLFFLALSFWGYIQERGGAAGGETAKGEPA
jgi:hypothetical protein